MIKQLVVDCYTQKSSETPEFRPSSAEHRDFQFVMNRQKI
jgi:hypothetical protein